MPIKIISGGQTGADQAGWRAARSLGLPTGGWMPRYFETEDGPRLEFAQVYGAVTLDGGYKERTQANARDSDATVWFGDSSSPGGVATFRACRALGRPVFVVEAKVTRPSDLTAWIVANFVEVLNVTGNRESTEPGIGERVERFLMATLGRLAELPCTGAGWSGSPVPPALPSLDLVAPALVQVDTLTIAPAPVQESREVMPDGSEASVCPP